MVRDPYWLHAYWELSRSTLARAQAALGQDWHTARPDPPADGRHQRGHHLAPPSGTSATSRSTAASTTGTSTSQPAPVVPDRHRLPRPPRQVLRPGPLQRRQHPQGRRLRRARRELGERPGAVPEDLPPVGRRQRLGRLAATSASSSRSGSAGRCTASRSRASAPAPCHGLGRGFHFEIDAELIVYGATEPNAKVTLQGEPVQLRPDGTFTVRFSLPDSRQIIPAVAASPDGVEERTIVLAVERNTKELEPMIHDGNEL